MKSPKEVAQSRNVKTSGRKGHWLVGGGSLGASVKGKRSFKGIKKGEIFGEAEEQIKGKIRLHSDRRGG